MNAVFRYVHVVFCFTFLLIEISRYFNNNLYVSMCTKYIQLLFILDTGKQVKPVLSYHSKVDKTKTLKTNGSLMKVESIAFLEREHSAILLTCIKR